jgi:zinc transport system substrate-binding protein
MRSRIAASVLALFVGAALAATAQPAPAPHPQGRTLRVVASTGWVAAFARTAGLDDVRVLAPYQMQHPPEYELKPSDVAAVAGADLVIYAGYERAVPRIVEALGGRSAALLKVATDNSLATIRATVTAIARAAGTEAQAARNLAAVEAFYADWKRDLAARGLSGAPVLVHAMQRPLAVELGFRIEGVFGPAALEAAQIRDLSQKSVRVVIDNAHDPVAAPLRETLRGARFVELINFPSRRGSLMDLLAEDRARLDAAVTP